jgi:integrase
MALRKRYGRWNYRFKADGKEYSGTTDLAATTQNESRAKEIEAEHRLALIEGRHPTRRLVVREFADAAKSFLEWAEVEYRAHPNSYKRINTSFASAKLFFGREPVSLIDEKRIEAYKVHRISEHEVRDITLRHDLHALSVFFGYAIKQGWVRENPIRNVSIPSDEDATRIYVISPQEEKHYFKLAAKNQELWDLGRLMLNQGMRPEEALALARTDVDLIAGQLYIRKGKTKAARRTLDLTSESRSILARRLQKGHEDQEDQKDSKWVFPSPKRPGHHILRLNSAHDRLCEKSKEDGTIISFVLYDFRHTFATRMAQAGVDLATLAAILGHNSLRIVQKYVHPTADHKRRAMQTYEQSLAGMAEQTKEQSEERTQ